MKETIVKNFLMGIMITCSISSLAQEIKMDQFINKKSQTGKSFEVRLKPQGSYSSGSGIGGGDIVSDLSLWCDTASITLDRALRKARRAFNEDSNYIKSYRLFYEGIIAAINVSHPLVSIESSITYRALIRGNELAHKLGVHKILSGETLLDPERQPKKIDEIFNFYEGYYKFLKQVTTDIDKNYYFQFYENNYCLNCPAPTYNSIDTDFERLFVKYATSQIEFWTNTFTYQLADRPGFGSNIEIEKTLKGLGYLATEAAKDLKDSLFDKAYSCQITRLEFLTLDIQEYLYERVSDKSKDTKRLYTFVNDASNIIHSIIKDKGCN